MDAGRFAPSAPGRLVPTVTRRGPDTGFIPDPLPLRWDVPAGVEALLAQAQAAIARLREAGEALRAPQLAASFLQLREAISSSASNRGAQATRALLRFEPVREGAYRDPRKAWDNAFLYRRVLRRALRAAASAPALPLRALIQEIHAGLFAGRPRRSVFPGRLRRGFIQMGARAHYVPAPYAYVVPCLAEMERGLARPAQIDPLLRAFMAHYQFVTIHPFADGNGRVGRILLAAMMNHAAGGAPPPLLYLSPFFARLKKQYVTRLFRVNTHGDWRPWIEFCLEGTIAEAAYGARVLAELARLRRDWRRLPGTGGAAPEALLDELLAAPAFNEARFGTLCAALGCEARQALAWLLESGIARPAPQRPGARELILPDAVALLAPDNF